MRSRRCDARRCSSRRRPCPSSAPRRQRRRWRAQGRHHGLIAPGHACDRALALALPPSCARASPWSLASLATRDAPHIRCVATYVSAFVHAPCAALLHRAAGRGRLRPRLSSCLLVPPRRTQRLPPGSHLKLMRPSTPGDATMLGRVRWTRQHLVLVRVALGHFFLFGLNAACV